MKKQIYNDKIRRLCLKGIHVSTQMIHRSWGEEEAVSVRMKLAFTSFSTFEPFSESCPILLHTHHMRISCKYSFLWVFHLTFHLLPGNLKKFETFSVPFHISLTHDFSTIAWKAEEIWGGKKKKKKNQNRESSQGYIQLQDRYWMLSFSGLPTPTLLME